MLCSAPLCSVCFIDLQSSGVIRRRSSRRRRWQRKEDDGEGEGAQGASTLLCCQCSAVRCCWATMAREIGGGNCGERKREKLLPNCVHSDVTATVDDTCASEHTLNTELQRRPLKLFSLQLSSLQGSSADCVRLSVCSFSYGQSKRGE